jgi:hypothetical protein
MCGGTVPENSLVHQDIQHQSFMSLCHGIFRIYFQFQTHYRIKKLSGVCVLSKNHYILGDYIMNHTYRTWIFHYTEMGKSLRIIYIYKYVFPSAFNIFNRCGKIGKPTVTVVMIWSFLKEKYWVPSTSIFVCWAFLAHPTWTKELCNHMPLLQTLPEGDGWLNGLNGWKPWPIYRWCSQLETSIYGWDFPWLC